MRNLFIILIFTHTIANADWFSNKLNQYTCKNEYEIYACSKNCKKESNYQSEFLVDKKNARVLRKDFENNQPFGSVTYDTCKIFDNKNWDCTETSSSDVPAGILSGTYISKMDNGIFYSHLTSKIISSKGVKTISNHYSCAK